MYSTPVSDDKRTTSHLDLPMPVHPSDIAASTVVTACTGAGLLVAFGRILKFGGHRSVHSSRGGVTTRYSPPYRSTNTSGYSV